MLLLAVKWLKTLFFFLPMLVRGAAFVTKLFRILVYEKKIALHSTTSLQYATMCVGAKPNPSQFCH